MKIKKSTATQALVFYMVDSTDHVTGKTGLAPTVLIAKNGGSFAAPIGAVSPMDHGFYKVAGNALDSDTVGVLALRATAAGADPVAVPYLVVENIESDSIAQFNAHATEWARLDAAVSTRLATAGYTAPANVSEGTIAMAVRSALLTELNRIDVAVSSRLATAGYTAPDNPANSAVASAVRGELATELARLDAAISTRASIASTGAQIAAFETA